MKKTWNFAIPFNGDKIVKYLDTKKGFVISSRHENFMILRSVNWYLSKLLQAKFMVIKVNLEHEITQFQSLDY